MNLALLGPQGSGKGTQAEKLTQKYHLSYFEMGNFLRELAKTRPDIDEVVNKRGALLDDNVVFNFAKEHLEEQNNFDNILFDGYPRSIDQYKMIEEFLKSKGEQINKIIFLQIPDEEAVRRLSARRMNSKTGEIYNLITNPPGPEVDEADLKQRADDMPEAIKQRLQAYHSTTAPLIEFLRTEGKVIEVDGTKSIDDVFSDICKQLEGDTNA